MIHGLSPVLRSCPRRAGATRVAEVYQELLGSYSCEFMVWERLPTSSGIEYDRKVRNSGEPLVAQAPLPLARESDVYVQGKRLFSIKLLYCSIKTPRSLKCVQRWLVTIKQRV